MITIDQNHQVFQFIYIVNMLLSALQVSFTLLTRVNDNLTLALSTQNMAINQADRIL